MTRRRMAATVAAGSLYVIAGWALMQAVQLVALPSVDALLEHNGLPTITRPAESTAPIGDEPTGYEWATWPEGSPRTAAPAASASLPLAIGTGPARVAEAGDPNPSPDLVLRGRASWYAADGLIAAAGPALREALGAGWRGTRVTVCASGCVTVVLSDWCQCYRGTDRERVIDLSDDAFRRLAPLSAGLVRVTVLGRIAPPETDADG